MLSRLIRASAVLLGLLISLIPHAGLTYDLNYLDAVTPYNVSNASHTIVLNPKDRSLLFFGGSRAPLDNFLWKLPLTPPYVWTKVAHQGSIPSVRWDHLAIYNSRDHVMVLHGSLTDKSTYYLPLDSSTPTWKKFGSGGATLPGNRIKHAGVYNPSDNTVVIFSGQGDDKVVSDVWRLSLGPVPTWGKITAGGVSPPARTNHVAVYNPTDNSMVIHGGEDFANRGVFLGDVWKLSLSTYTWTKLVPVGSFTPPIMAVHTAIYDPGLNAMIVAQPQSEATGTSSPVSLSTSVYQLGGMWALLLGSNPPEWVKLKSNDDYYIYVRSPFLFHSAAVYDPAENAMIIHSGQDVKDTYPYTYSFDLSPYGLYPIKGRVTSSSGNPLSAIKISITGGTTTGLVTNSAGVFSTRLTMKQNYTMTPMKTGYTFSPSSRSIVSLTLSQLNLTFTATTFTLSGSITDPNGSPLIGASVALDGLASFTTYTAFNGSYTFSDVPPGSYTLTASKTGYSFFANARPLTTVTHDTSQNFVGTSPGYFQASTYFFDRKWGSSGSGDGQFSSPAGMAANPLGAVAVVDTGNNRVQRFDTIGTFVSKWGSSGSNAGQFNSPAGAAMDWGGFLFTADTSNHRIQKFTLTGTHTLSAGSSGAGNGQFSSPGGVATDPAGNFYVADTNNHRIQKFTRAGVLMTLWGSSGSGDGQFSSPAGVAADHKGNIYVADTGNHRVQKFRGDGTFVAKWGSSGSGDGQFSSPKGVVSDWIGNAYVADTGNHRIQKFKEDGTFVAKWGSSGSGDGQFSSPAGIAVDAAGNVYVADTGNHRIQKFYPAYIVSGVVRDENSQVMSGVSLTITGKITATLTTAADGSYTITLAAGHNYFFGPAKSGIAFYPLRRPYLPLLSDQSTQAFAGFTNLVSSAGGGTVKWGGDPNTRVILPPLVVKVNVTVTIQSADDVDSTDQARLSVAGSKAADRIISSKIRSFVMQDENGTKITAFDKLATIEIPYTDDNNDGIVDGTSMSAKDLRILRLNETRLDWVVVADGGANTVDATRKIVSADVKHFSLYTIGQVAASNLTDFVIYPNPVNFSTAVRNTVKFDKLTTGASLKIFDLKGRLVKDLPAGSSLNDGVSGHVEWDGKNDQGESVASGLYFFLVTDTAGNKKTGKFAVSD